MTHHWGYIGAILSALFFAISSTFNKIVLGELHPILVASFVYIIAGTALGIIRISPVNKRILLLLETPTLTEDKIHLKDYFILSLVIISGSLIAPLFYMYGLNLTTAVNTSLLLNTESLFTVLIALVFLKERGRRQDYIGLIIIIISAVIITTSGQIGIIELEKGIFGSLLVIGACLFWGIDNNLSKFLSRKRDLILITMLKCGIGGIVLLLISYILDIDVWIPMSALPYLFTVGALSIGFSIMLFLFALREIGAMKTGVIFSTSSLIGALFAYIILQEPFTLIQAIAGVSMFYGVYLLYKK
jgi:drug/metabolite transporter (DMT)-like permease